MLTRTPLTDLDLGRPFSAGSPPPPRTRLLVDLSHAADGYVGIAQDIRLIFAMLAGLDSVELTGLLMPTSRHDLPVLRPNHPDGPALTASVLHWMERNWAPGQRRIFPLSLIQFAQTAYQLLRRHHAVIALEDRSQLNALWRVLFAKTLSPHQRRDILDQDFAATDLSVRSIIDSCAHAPWPMLKTLDAEGYDAVLFCMPRPVRLPPGVRQIVRFHDSVPVTDPDTVLGWKVVLAHGRLVRACAADAIFVCNSPQSRDSLLTLDPTREANAVVIPCAIAPVDAGAANIDPIAVIDRHVTFRALGARVVSKPAGFLPPHPAMRYVLSVSTLEPRKNFLGLIRAFERVLATTSEDLRLVIVAGPGWREADVLAEMRPHVESGRILHLQHVPTDELHALMAAASCFAFPSFNEGFGYSPIEAMQFGTPCVVSDIPVFRWIFGDTAEFVDPYDTASIAAGISRVLANPVRSECFAARAEAVLSRFRPDTIALQWQGLLENLPQYAGA